MLSIGSSLIKLLLGKRLRHFSMLSHNKDSFCQLSAKNKTLNSDNMAKCLILTKHVKNQSTS